MTRTYLITVPVRVTGDTEADLRTYAREAKRRLWVDIFGGSGACRSLKNGRKMIEALARKRTTR